jgi:hypothetical protein
MRIIKESILNQPPQPPPSSFTGTSATRKPSVAPAKGKKETGAGAGQSQATPSPRKSNQCSQCASCSSCACKRLSSQLNGLEAQMQTELSAHRETQEQLARASREIEILRKLVEQRSATSSESGSHVSLPRSAKEGASTNSVVSGSRASVTTANSCSTAEIMRLLDEYNREARMHGGHELKLPYWGNLKKGAGSTASQSTRQSQ